MWSKDGYVRIVDAPMTSGRISISLNLFFTAINLSPCGHTIIESTVIQSIHNSTERIM